MNHLLRDKNEAPQAGHSGLGQPRPGPVRPMRRLRAAGHSRTGPLALAEEGSYRIAVRSSGDILEARRRAREVAAALQFSSIDRALIASAVSELGRNIVEHAERGEICIRGRDASGNTGIIITAIDHGPGIRNVRTALQEGMGPARTLGLGLPGVRRIMDEFDIVSKPRQGTTVTVKKWKSQ